MKYDLAVFLMKIFGRIMLVTTLILITVLSLGAFAEGDLNSVKVYFSVEQIPTLVESEAVFELYDESGAVLLDTKKQEIKRGTGAFVLDFNVPSFEAGAKFKFVVASGAQNAFHDDEEATEHILQTYSMPDENGELVNYTSFYMNLKPLWNKAASIKLPTTDKTLYYHCIEGDEVYVTYDLLSELGISYQKFDMTEKPFVRLYTEEGKIAQFYINDIYALFAGTGINLSRPTFEIDTMPFVPLSKVALFFGLDYNVVKNDEYTMEIALSSLKKVDSAVVPELKVPEITVPDAVTVPESTPVTELNAKEQYINSCGITSKTDYFIWVSKKDFQVNVLMKVDGVWKLIREFPCSIGKPSTPTIEGSFEYYQYQYRWEYSKYYCGPVMRFKGGYALHSYLVKYDGTPYDARLGQKVSAGCVRMHPNDIQWLVNYAPLYTRVLVTA